MKPPPTDPPSPPRNDDEASARQAPQRSKRPSGHGSYRITDPAPDTPGPPNRPSGHGGYRLTDQSAQARYDDGVVHVPHYDADGHDDLHNEDTEHEHRDVDIRAITTSVVILAVITILSQVAMYLLFYRFEAHATSVDPQVSPLAAPRTEMPKSTRESPYFSVGVGGPRLMTNEPMALGEQRTKEAKQLHGWGWISQPNGVAYIPIDEAKKLILQRGLPVRQGDPVAPTLGTTLPAAGEASSGRVITGSLPDRPAAGAAEEKPEAAPPHKPGGH